MYKSCFTVIQNPMTYGFSKCIISKMLIFNLSLQVDTDHGLLTASTDTSMPVSSYIV